MTNITNKKIIISFFVTTFSLASTFIVADEEEAVPKEETFYGVPCQPFPECIVDSLRIETDLTMLTAKQKIFEDESFSRLNKETPEEQSAK